MANYKIPKSLEKTIYTTGEIAEMFGVSRRTATKWIDSGLMKGFRIPCGKDRRVPRESVYEFARNHGALGRILIDQVVTDIYEQIVVLTSIESDMPRIAMRNFSVEYIVNPHAFHGRVKRGDVAYAIIDFAIGRELALNVARSIKAIDQSIKIIAYVFEDEQQRDSLSELFTLVWMRPFTSAMRSQIEPNSRS
jgi:excisionase family DNA binding protein